MLWVNNPEPARTNINNPIGDDWKAKGFHGWRVSRINKRTKRNRYVAMNRHGYFGASSRIGLRTK